MNVCVCVCLEANVSFSIRWGEDAVEWTPYEEFHFVFSSTVDSAPSPYDDTFKRLVQNGGYGLGAPPTFTPAPSGAEDVLVAATTPHPSERPMMRGLSSDVNQHANRDELYCGSIAWAFLSLSFIFCCVLLVMGVYVLRRSEHRVVAAKNRRTDVARYPRVATSSARRRIAPLH